MREIRGGVFQGRFHNLLISKNNTFWAPQISLITFQVVKRSEISMACVGLGVFLSRSLLSSGRRLIPGLYPFGGLGEKPRTGAARRARLCRCTEPKSVFVQDWWDENQIGFRGIAWHGSVAQDPHLHRWRERAPGRLSGPLGPAWTLTLPHPALPSLISHPGQVWALRKHPRSPCLSTATRPYSRSHIYHPMHGHDDAARRP